MEIIDFYYVQDDSFFKFYRYAISSWYCKPSIIECLTFKMGATFSICTKYGCRQFSPIFSKSYPVYCYDLYHYKENLPWLIIEFNDLAEEKPWDSFPERVPLLREKSNYDSFKDDLPF